MGDVGQQLAVALGLVATVVGIVGALSQVTTAALLRRQVAFYRDVVQSKQQTATQAAVAASLRDRALALIVARQAVPLRRFALSTIGLVYVVVVVFLVGREAPNQVELYGFFDGIIANPLTPMASAFPVFVILATWCASATRGLLIQREHVVEQFERGASITVDPSFYVASETRRDGETPLRAFLVTLAMCTAVLWAAVMAGLLTAGPA